MLVSGVLLLRFCWIFVEIVQKKIRFFQINLALYSFSDSVQPVLRKLDIKPHWMFALSNLIQQAVQIAISILSPDLSVLLHVEDVSTPSSAAPTGQRSSLSRESGNSEPEPESRPPSREDRREVQMELRGIRADNDSLLEQLVQSEKELNEVLKSSLARTHRLKELYTFRHTYPPPCNPQKIILPTSHYTNRSNDDLVQWLKTLDVDERSIRAILSEGYTKIDILEFVSREELLNIGVRWGNKQLVLIPF